MKRIFFIFLCLFMPIIVGAANFDGAELGPPDPDAFFILLEFLKDSFGDYLENATKEALSLGW